MKKNELYRLATTSTTTICNILEHYTFRKVVSWQSNDIVTPTRSLVAIISSQIVKEVGK